MKKLVLPNNVLYGHYKWHTSKTFHQTFENSYLFQFKGKIDIRIFRYNAMVNVRIFVFSSVDLLLAKSFHCCKLKYKRNRKTSHKGRFAKDLSSISMLKAFLRQILSLVVHLSCIIYYHYCHLTYSYILLYFIF